MEWDDRMVNLALILAGSILPSLIGMILPRKKTIQYGMVINRFLGTVFLQKRSFKSPAAESLWQRLGLTIQTTFQDLSFGVYLDGRKDLTKEEKDKKITEYLLPAPTIEDESATPEPEETNQ